MALLYLLLWLPPVQQKMKDIALTELMKKTHNHITVGNFHFRPFNELRLSEVYIGDLQGDTLLYAEQLSSHFDLLPLLSKRLVINSVALDNFYGNVKQDSLAGDFNFQFLIDAFASEEQDTTSSAMEIDIRDITLKNGRVNYNVLSEPVLEENLFDYNHIQINDLQADVNFQSKQENLTATIKKLSFSEKSGLALTDLQTDFEMNGGQYGVNHLNIQFPHSQINISQAQYNADKTILLVLSTTTLNPADFKMFYPDLSAFSEKLSLSGKITGELPQIDLTQLQITYGMHLNVRATASIADYEHWQTSPVHLEVEQLSADNYLLGEILQITHTQIPAHVGYLTLHGKVDGTLPHLIANMDLRSSLGNLKLNATGGYDDSSKNSHFDATLHGEQVNVRSLMQDTLFGTASFQLKAKGNLTAAGYTNIEATAAINRFDFKNYAYNNIQLDGSFRGDSIRVNVMSDDNNVPLTLQARADIGKKTPGATVFAKIDCAYLDTLNLLEGYSNAFLEAEIRAKVDGFNPEKMEVALTVDSLKLYTSKGDFFERHFQLDYQAADNARKNLNIASHIVNAKADGHYSYAGLFESVRETFPMLFPHEKPQPKKKDAFVEDLNFRVGINNLNSLLNILDIAKSLPDSALIIGKYSHDGQDLTFSGSAYTQFLENSLQLSLTLANKANNLSLIFNVDNKSENLNVDGSIDADIEFIPVQGTLIPDMNIALNPSMWVLNDNYFDLKADKIETRGNQYNIQNLLFDYTDDAAEFISVNGIISANIEDSLNVDISQFQLSTILGAAKINDLPLTGVMDGRITGYDLLGNPRILSRNFAVNQMVFDENEIGDLLVRSTWSSERNGVGLSATLNRKNYEQSNVRGFYRLGSDSITLNAKIRDIELQWLQKMMAGTLYGLAGNVGADIQVSGKLQSPEISGMVHFNNAQMGVTQLNTIYTINDSIGFSHDKIELNKLTVWDENKHTLTANGTIKHAMFTDWNPNIALSLSDFQVLNNPQQTDSLLYGNLKINGLLNVKRSGKDWMITGDLTHANNSKIMVNLPNTASTAQHYNSITYINTPPEIVLTKGKQSEDTEFALPLKVNISMWFDPSLTLGAIFNPATGDAAHVTGNGQIKLAYDLNTGMMSVLGDYEIESGSAGLSIAGLTQKTFTVQQGGELVFHGDPLATTFDLTALYHLKANLTTLDPSFGNLVANPKVPVTCSLTAMGSMDKMTIEYDLLFPNESDEIQRKVDGLLYTDDMKIKELAYLLAFGAFLPASDNNPAVGGLNMISSLSSLTSGGLNKLLAGVLNDNWSVGTDLNTKDFNNLDVDLSVSGVLFNDRLTVNGSFGYHDNATNTNQNNFTGDFDVEYKLIPSGNLVLKAYNATNNQYYEQAPTTQGVGVVYKRQARTLRQMLDILRGKK